jgi:hypothetical protein
MKYLKFLLLFALLAFGADAQDEPDIYDRISAMADSLKDWAMNPPEYWNSEVLHWEDLFPNSTVIPMDSITCIISLPTYMEFLKVNMELRIIRDDSSNRTLFQWQNFLEISNDKLMMDSISILCPPEVLIDTSYLEFLDRCLVQLRTCALPLKMRTISTEGDYPVKVRLRGRSTLDFNFNSVNWDKTLAHLARGGQVYAGLIEIREDSLHYIPKYYILLTVPYARGHHFLILEEETEVITGKWSVNKSTVVFVPFVRTDNLKALFDIAPEEDADRDKWEIHLK